ncbi:uncharacterized protein LOC112559070 isoform X1 [Pomacea canaliculata]|uniref:uncharacterized protein LOC112559070 isoform X1 n=1 Tax=Pomacea canaliculata TaxID=400727 RepID=UPI000D72B77D|nr:uncharacterized protein LOC112559070 isoform X1 [Pomacea canaliculata]XP_025085884.1 uncharacterized protein LOC112559070 isoform X1 [Pomacea canaliculata]
MTDTQKQTMSKRMTLAVAMVLIVLAEGQDACIEHKDCTRGYYCTNKRCDPCEHLLAFCEDITLMLQEYPSCLQTCDDYKRNEQMKALEQIKNLTEKLEITTKQLHEAVQINAVLNKSISTLKYKVETEIKNITEQLTNTINQLQEKVQRNAVLNKSISTLKYKGETEIKNITEQLTNTTNQLQEKEKHNDEMATQLRKERIAFSVSLGILLIILLIILCRAVWYIIKLRRSCAENRRNPEPVPMENTSLPDHLPQQNGSYRLLLQKDESALSANGCLAKEAQQKNVSEAASPLLVDQLSFPSNGIKHQPSNGETKNS